MTEISRRQSKDHHHHQKKKKKREQEERELEEPESRFSQPEGIVALLSDADDAAAKQKRKEKKARKRLSLQEQDASTGDDCVKGNWHRGSNRVEDKKNGEEYQWLQEGNLHGENVNEEGKIMKKKKKKKKMRDVEASLLIGIEEEQEQEKNDEEGNLLRENNMEEKKSSKKRKLRKRVDEEEEVGSQGSLTVSSRGDHEQGKVKKAKKAKQAQGFLCEEGVDGDKCFVNGDENASFEAKKQVKKMERSHKSVHYEPEPDGAHKLSCNKIEVSKEPLADHTEQVTSSTMNSNSNRDFSQEETDREKKRVKKRKKVRFQDQVSEAGEEQVGVILEKESSENSNETVEEVWGVRFTSDEDEILKNAVWKYIKAKGWDEEEGLTKVLNSQKHKDARNCWADINMCLPHRPRKVIRYRAHLLLEKGAHLGKWSKEEEELLKRLQGEHGHKWKEISTLLDRNRTSIKEKWRTLKRSKGKGVWTQGELQRLSDMVHKCFRLKASLGTENKNSTHQILRDDIHWEKIADTIGTHSHGSCCGKWYYHLQSSLVSDGHWANEDDSLLLKRLLESGACVEEEVEWDSLLHHRSGQLCSTRWKQMVKHLGENRTRVFLDKLDVLARRYAPELLETSVEGDSSNKENPSGSDDISLNE